VTRPIGIEAEPGVELLRRVVGVGDDEDEVVSAARASAIACVTSARAWPCPRRSGAV
jgi:hypothetical protein